MNFPRWAVALCAGISLTACSPSSDDMMASARDYLSKNDINAASIQLKSLLQQDGTIAEARFLLGTILLTEGDVAGAVRELRRADELGFPKSRVLPPLAQAMVLNGDLDRVVRDFSNVQLDDPLLQSRILTRVGEAHLGQNDGRSAQNTFVTALGLNPDEPSAAVGLARSFLLLGDYDAAMSSADAVLAKHPEFADGYGVRAEVFRMRGDAEGFLEQIKAALEVEPNAENYHFSLVGALMELQRYEEARVALDEMKRLPGNRPGVHYLQAFLDFRMEKFKEAQEAIEIALRLAPSYLPANLLAGSIYFQLNDHVRVRQHMERVLGLEPQEPVARRVLAASHLTVGNFFQAREILTPLLDRPGLGVYDLSFAGQINLALGDFQQASEFFSKVRDLDPDDIRARAGRGLSMLALGDTESGFSELQTAASLDPIGQQDSMLILALLREKRFDEAFEAHKKLEEKQPEAALTQTLLGGIHLAVNDYDSARLAFERALQIDPGMLSAVVNLARLDIVEGDVAQARSRLEAFIARDKIRSEPYLILAELLLETNASSGEVLTILERATKANSQSRTARLALGNHLAASGELSKALTIAQELVSAQETDVSALSLLARIQAGMGDVQQAISSMNRVVNLQPLSAAPLALIAELQRAQSNHSGAEDSLRRALDLQPEAALLHQRLITLLVEQRRLREALDIARSIQRQSPNTFFGFSIAGDIFSMEGNSTEAIKNYREAVNRGAGVDVVVRLHHQLGIVGSEAEATRLSEEWRAKNPNDVNFGAYLAEILVANGEYEQAEQDYRQMLALEPENPMLLNNLAWVAGRLGKDDALSLSLKALEISPDNPAVLDTVGMLQIKAGYSEQGLSSLKRAVVFAPNIPRLRLNLAKAYLDLGQRANAERELTEVLHQTEPGSPIATEAKRLLGE